MIEQIKKMYTNTLVWIMNTSVLQLLAIMWICNVLYWAVTGPYSINHIIAGLLVALTSVIAWKVHYYARGRGYTGRWL